MKNVITLSAILAMGLSSLAFAADNAPDHAKKPLIEQQQDKGKQQNSAPEHKGGDKNRPHNGQAAKHNGDAPKHDAKDQGHNPSKKPDGREPQKDGKKPLPPEEKR